MEIFINDNNNSNNNNIQISNTIIKYLWKN
jgi:hypothetical protein